MYEWRYFTHVQNDLNLDILHIFEGIFSLDVAQVLIYLAVPGKGCQYNSCYNASHTLCGSSSQPDGQHLT